MNDKPVVLVTRKLPDAVEARLQRDYAPRLNAEDEVYSAEQIIALAGVKATVTPIPHTEFPTAARRPQFSVLSNAKLLEVIGDIPDWQDALTRYLKAKGHMK